MVPHLRQMEDWFMKDEGWVHMLKVTIVTPFICPLESIPILYTVTIRIVKWVYRIG